MKQQCILQSILILTIISLFFFFFSSLLYPHCRMTKKWDAGVIYCSLPTANLVCQQIGVDRKYLHPLPMNTPVVVLTSQGKEVTVTLLDANHCPGAVMFFFEVGKQRRILHVGDFRWNRTKMLLEPSAKLLLCNEQKRIDELFLDTTYCDPKYVLPTQEEAIQATIEVAVKEVEASKSSRQRILMLFGAYTIGKERVYLSVAERLGLKVYVDKRRYKILSALEWPESQLKILTTRPEESVLWVVPLGHINMKKLPEYLSVKVGKFGRDFDRVVGFRPTGWSMTAKGGVGLVKSSSRGKLTVHSVPYSEHSSFPELVDCIGCLRPKRIVPTVSVSKSREQVDLLLNSLKSRECSPFNPKNK
jgi:DNA cross-link repair 1A protein